MFRKIKELFKYRQLIFDLAIKDLKVKYREAIGGFSWIIILPMAMCVVFYVLFKLILKVDIENYPFFLLCGLLPWAFLQISLSESIMSIVGNANLIKKAYFPRAVLPLSIMVSHMINFVISLAVLFIVALLFKVSLIRVFLWLPFILITQLLLIAGLSLIISALNACYRDMQFATTLFLLVWFYATPVVYPVELIRSASPLYILRLYMLNPMVGIVAAYRDLFLYSAMPDMPLLGASLAVSIVLFMGGLLIFNHFEKRFIDII